MSSAPKRVNHVRVTWLGEQRFEAGVAGRPTIRIDGNRESAPSPVDTLLSALGSCASIDVTEILAKRRTPVESLQVQVSGDRFDGTPARVTRIVLAFTIRGRGIERVHAERAIELSVNKYCSVRDTLDPAVPVEWTLDLSS